MGDPRDQFYPPRWSDLSEAEREERTETECENSDIAAHRLYRSPLANLILQRSADLVAELEAIAVKLPEFCQAVKDMEAAEIAIDEDYPLANFNLRLDDCFGVYVDDLPGELDNVINALILIAEQITNARKDT